MHELCAGQVTFDELLSTNGLFSMLVRKQSPHEAR
jgi:hypothetical protein